jgi:hypothetical protein
MAGIDPMVRILRSRRLAAILIVVTVAYVLLGTLVPQGVPTDPRVRAWADASPTLERLVVPLGLHTAYSTPVFLGLAALLVVCTAACAWERTERAFRLRRRMAPATPEQIERLAQRPQTAVALSPDVSVEAALAAVSARLRRAGLRVRATKDRLEATSGEWTAFGSAAFHWTLVALALVLAAGQATRSEGAIDVPIGVPVVESHAAYVSISEGPFFGERHAGVAIVVSDLVHNFGAGGFNRGPAPVVTLRRGADAVASGRVYPNNPLSYGPLLIHMVEYGLAPAVAFEDADGAMQVGQGFMLEFSRETSSGTVARATQVSRGASLPPIAMRIEVPVDRDATGILGSVPRAPRALVAFGLPGGSLAPTITLELGKAVDLPGGGKARLVDVQNWVRILVANDWSVPYVYLLGMLACVALAVALFVPARAVRVLVVEAEAGNALHLASWHARGDPAFAARVRSIMNVAAGADAPVGPEAGGEA